LSIPGADGLLTDVSPAWRRAGYAALTAAFITGAYFLFVDGRIANAMDLATRNEKRIDGVQSDIKEIRGDIADIKNTSSARDQKLDDLKEQMNAMNAKIDRLLMQRHTSNFP